MAFLGDLTYSNIGHIMAIVSNWHKRGSVYRVPAIELLNLPILAKGRIFQMWANLSD